MGYTLNNGLKVFLKDKQGVELKKWLDEHGEELKNHRIFYILRANLEKGDVFKIGLSERGNNSAFGRLNDYFHFYGKTNGTNPCMGVKLFLVVGNLFNPSIQASDAKVRQLETKMIQSLGTAERGRERFKISIDRLYGVLEKTNLMKSDEKAESTKRSTRILAKNQASRDTVKAIVSHKIDRKGSIKFEAEFYDAIVYDKQQNATKKKLKNKHLSYYDLIQLREGQRLVDEYMEAKGLDESDDDELILDRIARKR